MADTKLTALTEVSVPVLSDISYTVADPGGTPASDKITWARLAGLVSHSVPQIRLTTETGVPVSTSDRTAQATLYATPSTPYGEHLDTAFLRTWDLTRTKLQSFTGDKSYSPTIVSGAVKDVFIKNSDLSLTDEYWKNSTVTMTIASPCVVTWTAHGLTAGDAIVFATSGALPTGLTAGARYIVGNVATDTFQVAFGVGSTAINTSGSQSGTQTAYLVGVLAGNTTQPRTNALVTPSGTDLICSGTDNTFLWLGTIWADGTNTIADSGGLASTTQVGGFRGVWNAYNQVLRPNRVIDTTDNWSHTAATTTTSNGVTFPSNAIRWVSGFPTQILIKSKQQALMSLTGAAAYNGVGIDSITAFTKSAGFGYNGGASNIITPLDGIYENFPGIGAHFAQWMERGPGGASAVCTFYGDDGSGIGTQNGVFAQMMG